MVGCEIVGARALVEEDAPLPDVLAELFSSRVRAVVLALLLPRPHLTFTLTELSRRLGLPVSSLQHECYKLTRIGVLRDERVGAARRYRPDPDWPLLAPLTALTVHAMAVSEALQGAVECVPGLVLCWVSGDPNDESAPLYLVLVGDLNLDDLDDVFRRARVVLETRGAEHLELAYFRYADWSARIASEEPFAAQLGDAPRLDVVVAAGLDMASSPKLA